MNARRSSMDERIGGGNAGSAGVHGHNGLDGHDDRDSRDSHDGDSRGAGVERGGHRHAGSGNASATVLAKDIERARREHKLSTTVLAMLAGLTDAQVQAIEEGSASAFVNDAHRIDCAQRIAVAMGFAPDRFLQRDAPPVQPRRIIKPASLRGMPREHWEHLPVASLDVLATLRATELPLPTVEQRRGSPMVVALLVALVLAGLMLALATLH